MPNDFNKDPESVIEELPIQYFDPNFDPVEMNLKEISEWGDLETVEVRIYSNICICSYYHLT